MNNTMTTLRSNILGIASITTGVIGLGISFIPYIGAAAWLLAPIAIIAGIVSLQRPPRIMAIVGILTGLAALGASVTYEVMRRNEATKAEQEMAKTASSLDTALIEMGKRPEGYTSSTPPLNPINEREAPPEGATSAFAPPRPPQPAENITLGEYNTLETGMSYDQSVYLIGGEGKLTREMTSGAIEVKTYEWMGTPPNAVAQIQFQNDKLSNKMQTGLE